MVVSWLVAGGEGWLVGRGGRVRGRTEVGWRVGQHLSGEEREEGRDSSAREALAGEGGLGRFPRKAWQDEAVLGVQVMPFPAPFNAAGSGPGCPVPHCTGFSFPSSSYFPSP